MMKWFLYLLMEGEGWLKKLWRVIMVKAEWMEKKMEIIIKLVVQKLKIRVVQKLKIRMDQVVRIMIGYMKA